MTLTISGSIAFNAAMKPTVDRINAVLGDRIGDAVVVGKPGDQMPQRSDGGPSYGFWRTKMRQIWLWDDLDEYPVNKTLWHEAMHVLDDDYFTKAQRGDLMGLMVPEPTGWYDTRINGVKRIYIGLPSECFAVYASAALGGFEKPAYTQLFLRRVPRGEWPLLAETALKDYGPPVVEPTPPEPIPTPPDPAAAEITELRAALTVIHRIAGEKVQL